VLDDCASRHVTEPHASQIEAVHHAAEAAVSMSSLLALA